MAAGGVGRVRQVWEPVGGDGGTQSVTSQVFLPDPLLLGWCLTKETRSQKQVCLESLCLKLETQSS